MVGLVIVLLVLAAGGGYLAGYKYGAEDLKIVLDEIDNIESDIKNSSVIVRAEHVIARLKALF